MNKYQVGKVYKYTYEDGGAVAFMVTKVTDKLVSVKYGNGSEGSFSVFSQKWYGAVEK